MEPPIIKAQSILAGGGEGGRRGEQTRDDQVMRDDVEKMLQLDAFTS